MNPLHVLFDQPWIARLGWTLLHFLWQGFLIAAVLSVFRARPASAAFRYASACAALAAMAAAPLVTFWILGNGYGIGEPAQHAMGAAALAASGTMQPSPLLPSAWDWISPRLGLAWLLGAVLCSVRLLGGWLVASRLRTAAAGPAPLEWQTKLRRLMPQMGVTREVRLRISSLLEAPVVIGWLRPLILVPAGALAGLSAGQVEALLAHELAHIRRHDYLVNLVQSFAEAVLFYHPAVWWVSRQIRAEREHCCDDLAVQATGDVLTYARALAELESCRPAHAQAMAATGGSLRNRIRRLVDPGRTAPHTLPAGGAAWALSAILVIGAGAVAVRGAESVPPLQEATVNLQEVWPDTVKQGDMKVEVRGLGTLKSATEAEAKLAISQSVDVVAGQPALIAFQGRHEIIAGQVVALRPGPTTALKMVDLAVLAPRPAGVNLGDPIDVSITIAGLTNVLYVGRPVFAAQNSQGDLFKIDPDGKHATRVNVQFGRSSVNSIEVKSGLQLGDRVILSDMSAYKNYDRIAVQ